MFSLHTVHIYFAPFITSLLSLDVLSLINVVPLIYCTPTNYDILPGLQTDMPHAVSGLNHNCPN
jgi:hypothetical protein